MDFVGLVMILAGVYLLWAPATNRKPGALAKSVIADPKNARAAVAAADAYALPTNADVHPEAYSGASAGATSAEAPVGTSANQSDALALSAVSGGYGAAAVAAARTKLGAPYVWGASGPNAFDCSGLVSWAYKAAGHNIGRVTTATILANLANFPKVDRANMQAGDLLFPYAGHVGMVVDSGTFIEARGSVRISPITSIMAIRRVK